MAVTTTNLIQGPGTLYVGDFGAAPPASTASGVIETPAAPTWRDVGGTTDGVTLSIAQEFSELAVDQIVDVPGRRLTRRDLTIATNLAEPTLENLALVMNAEAEVDLSVDGVKILNPTDDTSATQPDYKALIMDGFAPDLKRRRVIVRKVLSTAGVETAYTKDSQTVFPVTFSAHYVSSSVKPFTVIDEDPTNEVAS
jgi:hypothetical protein